MIERVVVVAPRGFCAGVERAIVTVERALAIFPPPVYVRGAIVHNATVVARLVAAGATFVDELDEVPPGSVVVLSAHGVPAAVDQQAKARRLRVIDATCPLVAKVHQEVRRYCDHGFEVVLVGHRGHDEVVGTLGQAPGVHLVETTADVSRLHVATDKVACVTQTTLNSREVAPVIEQLRRRFPTLALPGSADVCYATRNRQAAIAWLAGQVDVVLVVGDATSSNCRRLREVARAAGTPAYLIQSVAGLSERWLVGATLVGVSAGASTPEDLVAEVVARLAEQGAIVEERRFVDEAVAFSLPADVAPVAVDSGRSWRVPASSRGRRRAAQGRRRVEPPSTAMLQV